LPVVVGQAIFMQSTLFAQPWNKIPY